MVTRLDDFVEKLQANARTDGLTWAISTTDGQVARLGSGEPAFNVSILNDEGWAAIQSLNELAIAEAYMRCDIDFSGDFFKVMELRHLLKGRSWILSTWAQVAPLVVGRKRLNPKWIAKHYDSKNVQVLGLDRDYAVYTPGIYQSDDDTLEAGAARKLQNAFSSLGLEAGASLLDVGCGWGGMLRYCARRGVEVTGITLSRHQLEYTQARLREDGLDGTVLYQDFFTFEPGRRYDAISAMGVMEELSDYDLVMKRLRTLLAPGGRGTATSAPPTGGGGSRPSSPSTSGPGSSGSSTCPTSSRRWVPTASRSSSCTTTASTTTCGRRRPTNGGWSVTTRWWRRPTRRRGG